ncbi:uncharacterized protein LOC113009184 [Astatotilapia calliptera]|uniref:uncharacterized protein LOC113009184 n=1 Tax=Astatotilapia calliptera TaxID=8154 RepID=UPI000E42CD4E|nr:uncharacterized protein LOC113009184 [Astatotilapia calliptera]XP_026003149.1 uncharacterized protein LOC113009184 [Astatotilapia calliptera]
MYQAGCWRGGQQHSKERLSNKAESFLLPVTWKNSCWQLTHLRMSLKLIGWDSDLSAILLLLHLIPPSGQGRKRPGKVSASQAERRLVVFKKTGTNIQEHLDSITTSTQPYLLAVGVKKNDIHRFFIILDKNAMPCKSTSSLGTVDELFKAHFVFGTSYNTMLHNMYMFIQTTGFRKYLNTKHLNYFDQQADTDVNLQPDVAVKEVSTTGEVMSTNVEETPTTSEKVK